MKQLRLSDLNSLEIPDKTSIPNCVAVYIVTGKRGKVLYVGETAHLALRINSGKHHAVKHINAKKVHWIELPADLVRDRLYIEALLIEKLNPEFNRGHVPSRRFEKRRLLACKQCGSKWEPRKTGDDLPTKCPKCFSPRWQQDRPKQQCVKCKYKWLSSKRCPVECPNCKTRDWNKKGK